MAFPQSGVIADDAVSTPKIKDGAITRPKVSATLLKTHRTGLTVGANSIVNTTISWPSGAFADAAYNVALGLYSPNSRCKRIWITSKTAAAIVVQVQNDDVTNPETVEIHAIAIKDA